MRPGARPDTRPRGPRRSERLTGRDSVVGVRGSGNGNVSSNPDPVSHSLTWSTGRISNGVTSVGYRRSHPTLHTGGVSCGQSLVVSEVPPPQISVLAALLIAVAG